MEKARMIPTPGQSAFAHAASARLDAGDDDGRVVADLLTVVSAMISDMPDIRSRRAALLAVNDVPSIVARLARQQAAG
jgi:hypothetical protein